MSYVPHTATQIEEMLQEIGVKNYEDLIKAIPLELRLENGIDIPNGLSELEVINHLSKVGSENRKAIDSVSFLGGGSYDHFIPSAVNALLSRSEWYTAYTPYQPEVSQGTLQAIYEYQSVVCDITGMDVANASVYDGATALTEAMLLALRHGKRKTKILVSAGIHPHYMQVIDTYASTSGVDVKVIESKNGITDIHELDANIDDSVAAFIFSQPNFFGLLEDADSLVKISHGAGALAAVSVYPVSLGMLSSPGEYMADIVTAEGQCLGNPVGFGGPYLGIFAAKQKLIRQIPGRISGETVDRDGKRGYVLTLQTREQHIRRGKATSNICTNEGLNALAAVIYMALIGKRGFQELAELCYHKAHYLYEQICNLDGYSAEYPGEFFNEFTIHTPVPAKEVVDKAAEKGFFPGIRLDRFYPNMDHSLLIAVTEKRSRQEMDDLVEVLAQI